MAQVTMKGFVTKVEDATFDYKDKKISKTVVSFVDESSGKENIFFLVEFVGQAAVNLPQINKGDRAYIKAQMEQDSFQKKDSTGNLIFGENGAPITVYKMRYRGLIYQPYAEALDLDAELANLQSKSQ